MKMKLHPAAENLALGKYVESSVRGPGSRIKNRATLIRPLTSARLSNQLKADISKSNRITPKVPTFTYPAKSLSFNSISRGRCSLHRYLSPIYSQLFRICAYCHETTQLLWQFSSCQVLEDLTQPLSGLADLDLKPKVETRPRLQRFNLGLED